MLIHVCVYWSRMSYIQSQKLWKLMDRWCTVGVVSSLSPESVFETEWKWSRDHDPCRAHSTTIRMICFNCSDNVLSRCQRQLTVTQSENLGSAYWSQLLSLCVMSTCQAAFTTPTAHWGGMAQRHWSHIDHCVFVREFIWLAPGTQIKLSQPFIQGCAVP